MKIVYDTTEFSDWAQEKYNMSNNEWHKKIWSPLMCDYFMNSNSSVRFSKMENPENILDEHLNEFLDEVVKDNYVWLEFTN